MPKPQPNGYTHTRKLRQIKAASRSASSVLNELDALLIAQAGDPPTSRNGYKAQYYERARVMNRLRDALALVEEAADEAIERVDW